MALLLLTALLFAQTSELERASALHEQGFQLYEAGKAEEGIASVQQSFALHVQLGKVAEQTVNLRLLAFMHDGIGERQRSLEFYQKAITLTRATKDQALEARTLRDIGVLYYNLDDNARAFENMNRALALQRRISKPAALAATLFSIGELRRYHGQSAEARELFEETLTVARAAKERQPEADALASLAMLNLKAGQLDEASVQLKQSLAIREEIKDARGEASSRAKLGFLLDARGDTNRARQEMRTAADRFAQQKYRGGEAFARQGLAQLERKAGNLEEAAAQMLRAVELADGLRQRLSDRDLRATYIGYVQNRYEFLIETYLALDGGKLDRAFEMSERARARALVESFSDSGLEDRPDRQPTLRLAEIQNNVLNADTTLVEYSLGEAKSHVFIVTQSGISHQELPGRAAIEKIARQAYELYRKPEALMPRARLAPLLAEVRTSRVVIVADGALQYLPFAHLYPKTTVVLAPSASALAAMRARSNTTHAKRLSVIADPIAPQFARLAFARQEAESILALVPEAQRNAAIGEKATKMAALSMPAQILHFATHSVLSTESPEKTEIVLSGGSLRLRDIFQAKISSDLVVLSACQTALGKEMKREGMVGLARAFELAGARRVVSSLWKVDDRATAELMKHFYEGMFRRNLGADAALRSAQNKIAANSRWSNPYYWAGFVLEGDWR